jgi:hypothetical protein
MSATPGLILLEEGVGMRQAGKRKKALLGALFGVLFTLGAATAAFTAGAAPFGAEATTTIVTTITTGSSTVVSTITTTTPDSTSSTGSTTDTATTTITTTTTTPRKITICHHARGKKGAVKHVTIRINRSAWTAHQKHGDSVGACNTATAKKFHSRAAHIKKWHKKKKK